MGRGRVLAAHASVLAEDASRRGRREDGHAACDAVVSGCFYPGAPSRRKLAGVCPLQRLNARVNVLCSEKPVRKATSARA
jgi:hypothetical protein